MQMNVWARRQIMFLSARRLLLYNPPPIQLLIRHTTNHNPIPNPVIWTSRWIAGWKLGIHTDLLKLDHNIEIVERGRFSPETIFEFVWILEKGRNLPIKKHKFNTCRCGIHMYIYMYNVHTYTHGDVLANNKVFVAIRLFPTQPPTILVLKIENSSSWWANKMIFRCSCCCCYFCLILKQLTIATLTWQVCEFTRTFL